MLCHVSGKEYDSILVDSCATARPLCYVTNKSLHGIYAGVSAYDFSKRCDFVFSAPHLVSFPCVLSSAYQVKLQFGLD